MSAFECGVCKSLHKAVYRFAEMVSTLCALPVSALKLQISFSWKNNFSFVFNISTSD